MKYYVLDTFRNKEIMANSHGEAAQEFLRQVLEENRHNSLDKFMLAEFILVSERPIDLDTLIDNASGLVVCLTINVLRANNELIIADEIAKQINEVESYNKLKPFIDPVAFKNIDKAIDDADCKRKVNKLLE